MSIARNAPHAKPRWLALLVTVALLTGLTATVALAAPPKITIDQCRNGSAADRNHCDDTAPNGKGWVNGNAGASNAHFVEGHSIPYRARLTDVPQDTITVELGYDIKHSGVHAIDFLTHYDRLEPHGQFGHPAETVDPLAGVSGMDGTQTATCPIPKPGNLSTGSPSASATFDAIAAAGKDLFTVFGASSCTVEMLDQGDTSAAKSQASVVVTFDATNSTVVMAWGGHIARTADWAAGGAAGISGSPYHMRLLFWSAGNVGNQDRSLSAAAVESEASQTTTTLHQTDSDGNDISPANNGASISVPVDAFVKDVANIAPSNATGTAEFRFYGPYATSALAIAACEANDSPTPAGSNIAVSGGTAESTVVQFTDVGFYAWRVFFTGSGIFEDSTSDCDDEILEVEAVTSTLSTAPWIYPNDDATVSASAGGELDGNLNFRLYDTQANCQTDDGTGLLYEEDIEVSGESPQTESTSNDSVAVDESTTVWWRVEYTSDNANQSDQLSDCAENIEVKLTGDTVPAP